MPRVSVIVPIYNVKDYIDRCARSLFDQTLDDVEFLFIDDCSPDDSMLILSDIIKECHTFILRKRWIVRTERMPTNCGLPTVRRHGVQLATGDYIIHCDSDDWMENNMLEIMWKTANTQNADVVISDYNGTDGKDKHKYYRCVEIDSKDTIIRDLMKAQDWTVWNKLVSRKIYKNGAYVYPTDNMGEDVVLTIQNLYYATKISYVHKPLYNYFQNNESITRSKDKTMIINRCNQCWRNVKIVEKFVEFTNSRSLENSLIALKLEKRNLLLPIISEDNNYKLWFSTFSEINRKVMFSTEVSLKEKVRFCINIFKMYMQ